MTSVAADSSVNPIAGPPAAAAGRIASRAGGYWITTEAARLDLPLIGRILSRVRGSPGPSAETCRRAIEHSLAFGLFHGERQVGFVRVVSDRATFAYLTDLFVLDDHRGRGLGSWLISVVAAHPELQGVRGWLVKTRDAHAFYRKHGFVPLPKPEWWMSRVVGEEG